jgi:hypothetical protein
LGNQKVETILFNRLITFDKKDRFNTEERMIWVEMTIEGNQS